ncbi:hypothetical protein EAX61_09245 [Dokdonia sinensis]|uniref:Uncharacterized protein n=1 Tax=Dokdonia sinensis TaxID=2479847 RepID=A0A3M0GA20_9FLAO|nr:hypothetical protein [Dokdonia sinensis]RMB58483.1 hypothetical protein EAX61_09245 [Dokdonia sinensis]
MEIEAINPYRFKANNEINAEFILAVFFCSKIETFNRKLLYFFYFTNHISHNTLKFDADVYTDEYLLGVIFKSTENQKILPKKVLRELTGLKDRGTFNKYFNAHLQNLGLQNRRVFTFSESYMILKFWQDEPKGNSFEAFSKGEIAKRFTNGDYERLDLLMTNGIVSYSEYINYDYIKPSDLNKLLTAYSELKVINSSFESKIKYGYLELYSLLFILKKYNTSIKSLLKKEASCLFDS